MIRPHRSDFTPLDRDFFRGALWAFLLITGPGWGLLGWWLFT